MYRSLAGAALLVLTLLAVATATPPPLAGPPVTVTISGTVRDAAGSPLAGAQVLVRGARRGTITDHAGRYRLRLENERPGASIVLVARLVGYRAEEARLVAGSEQIRHDFVLRVEERAEMLEELVVTRESRRTRDAAVGVEPVFSAQAARGLAAPPPPGWNTERYAYISENGFLAADRNPLSTFSIDVDRASYSNVRRFIHEGRTPPIDAVRIEELINYFPYSYPAPRGDEPFSVTTEVAAAPWQPQHRLLRIGLQSRPVENRDLPPSNFVFLIDVSGSMNMPQKLPLVKQSLRLLVNELRERDRVAIVVYAGAAGLVLPSTPGSEKTRILAAIEALEAGGSTAGGAGLQLAYSVARENHVSGGNNRVILATDGDFNVGVSSESEMIRLVEARRRQGTFLTVLGFGTGNLNDSMMERIADHGNGIYAYIDSLLEARKVLVSEMGGTLLTVARDVKLQVEFNPAQVLAYRLIGYENRLLEAEDFNDDARDAGDLGAGHSVTALYEVIPVGARTEVPVRGVDPLRFQTPERSRAPAGGEMAFVKVRYKTPEGETSRLLERPVPGRVGSASPDMAFAAAVAGFGMILRDSEHRGSASLDQVLRLAGGARGDDREGYRADFVALVERYRALEPVRASTGGGSGRGG